MKSALLWSDKVQDRDGAQQPIYDVAFSPDGSTLLAAAGAQVLVYDVQAGDLVQTLKAHKDTVFCLGFSHDGTRFASGSADKQVIIWNDKFEGILKYAHNDPVQCIALSPVNGMVLSCSTSDFGLWSSEQKSVIKHKIGVRVCACSWSPDGQIFALGLYNGQISVRVKTGEEKVRIDRGTSPVWSLSWCPAQDQEEDLLVVADWNQRLSFYQSSGKQVGKDKTLGFDPCVAQFCPTGEYVVVGGSDRNVTLWTGEGVRLGPICEREHWVWSAKVRPPVANVSSGSTYGGKQEIVAVGCHDGSIALYQVTMSTVHALYNDRYAFRENMTDIVIQHLATDQRARIKCRDYVQRIAICRDRLAVQLPDRVIVYELHQDDATDMHYRIKDKIQRRFECNLMVVASNNLVLCSEKRLQSYNFSGELEREWAFDAMIRYMKITGGPRGREGLLLGLSNGQIIQVFIHNAFPIPLIKLNAGIRCIDLNASKKQLAVVDDHHTLLVYDLETKDLVFQEPNATSVAWNAEINDMLCYSGSGTLFIKSGTFAPVELKVDGIVVGFKGSKVFCLTKQNQMITVDVPLATMLERYMDIKDFESAYRVACMGATETEWRKLAMDSLENLKLTVAKKAFVRCRDLKFMDLIRHIEKSMEKQPTNTDLYLAEIAAYSGKFVDASKLYRRAGYINRAIDMYIELHMWENALQLAEESHMDTTEILRRKAIAQADRNDLMAAAQTYIEVGDYIQAIEILGPNGWTEKLIEVARKLNKSDGKALSRCVHYFKKANHHAYAAETLVKMGDVAHLVQLHIELQHWDEAFKLAEMYPELGDKLYYPYARYLATNDRFVEAQAFYKRAGRPDEAFKMLKILIANAIDEQRYTDAGHYYFILAKQTLENMTSTPVIAPAEGGNGPVHHQAMIDFKLFMTRAQMYYAYHAIHRYNEEPFTQLTPRQLFNRGVFLLNTSFKTSFPPGVSRTQVLYALSKVSKQLGAFKVARYALEKLYSSCVVPVKWEGDVDVNLLYVRSKPHSDNEQLASTCPRCHVSMPILNPKGGDACMQCGLPIVRSMVSFEPLPLAQFVPEQDLGDHETIKLIETEPPLTDQMNSLRLEDEHEDILGLTASGDGNESRLTVATRDKLLKMDRHDVFIREWSQLQVQFRNEYFRRTTREEPIVICNSCYQFFHEDEWNFEVLQNPVCPFCRTNADVY